MPTRFARRRGLRARPALVLLGLLPLLAVAAGGCGPTGTGLTIKVCDLPPEVDRLRLTLVDPSGNQVTRDYDLRGQDAPYELTALIEPPRAGDYEATLIAFQGSREIDRGTKSLPVVTGQIDLVAHCPLTPGDGGPDLPEPGDGGDAGDAGGDADGGPADAADGDGPDGDASLDGGDMPPDLPPPVAPPPCNLSSPFVFPTTLLLPNTDADELHPFLSVDGLRLYFASTRPGGAGGHDLYVTRRSSVLAPFSPNAEPVAGEVNTPGPELSPTLTADELTLYYVSAPPGSGTCLRIYRATRARATDPFGPGAPVPELASAGANVDPYITPDGQMLYFASNREGSATCPPGPPQGNYDVYQARMQANGQFAQPVRPTVPGLSTSSLEARPVLRGDGLALYFSSDREGNLDVFVARRPTVNDPFGAPTRVAELSSPMAEDGFTFSFDGCIAFFGSNRSGGGFDLFQARRPICDRRAPFLLPTHLTSLNSAATDAGAFLTFDGLQLFFHSTREGGAPDLYVAGRADPQDELGPAMPVSSLNSASEDSSPRLTADGLTIYFCSDRPGGQGGRDLWRAERSTPDGAFGPPENVTELNSPGDDCEATVLPDGQVIYLASDRGGDHELYRAQLGAGGVFSMPELVTETSDPSSEETYPVITADGLALYFASSRPGGLGGASDIWVVRRTNVADLFGTPILLSEISSPDGDISSSVSPDGCTLLISSDRDGTRGGRDLLVASRPTCSHEEAFRRPERVAQLGGPTDEWTPFLTFDSTSLYFARRASTSASSDLDLFVARRVNSAAPFGQPMPLEELNTSTLEWGPTLTADGLTLYFASGRDTGSNDIFRATRATTSQSFGTPQPVAQLNSVQDDRDPHVSPDGRTLYFSSNRGGGDYEIYVATLEAGGLFGTPQALVELGGAGTIEQSPAISADGLGLYFRSTRGTGVWLARRTSSVVPFDPPQRLTEIGITDDVHSMGISPDNCTLYFSTDRPGGAGGYDLWQAQRR